MGVQGRVCRIGESQGYMRAFAEAWPDSEFVQQVLAQLPWCHQITLLDKLSGPETRRWYITEAIKHSWSRNTLVLHIESRLLERSGKAVNNFENHLPKAQSDLARDSAQTPQACFSGQACRHTRLTYFCCAVSAA